jgi:hypothetical protein
MFGRPFPPDVISWRVGATNGDKTKGIALAYIDARDVMNRLDEMCVWECRYPWSDGHRVCCEISVWADEGIITRSDGAGETDVEGDKGAMSDAFKRAAVRFNVARYLYDLPSPWVEIAPAGKSYKIADPDSLTTRLAEWQKRKFGDTNA